MKFGLYPKLAWTGIRKNHKLYLPYIITSVCMVMIFYVVSFLQYSEDIAKMRGGYVLQGILILGTIVITIFSLIFLIYTNSFLMRRRKTEFGLYNILGMGKRNLARILFWETLIVTAISIVGGLACGVLFSKLAELLVFRILNGLGTIRISVSLPSMGTAALVYIVIFALVGLKSLNQIRKTKPVELLHSQNVGEKPPRSNWVLAVLGVVLLGGAYYIAITTLNPLAAILLFFVAVVMVILATYLLFIAGSVTFCKLLKRNRRYYYKTNHFVSTSSMLYRMKRNGAGLATICILCTMVLVTISATMCLYLGQEDMVKNRYPRDMEFTMYSTDPAYTQDFHQAILDGCAQYGLTPENVQYYRYLELGCCIEGNQVWFDDEDVTRAQAANTNSVAELFLVPLEDYNTIMGASETLEPDQVLVYRSKGMTYGQDTLDLQGLRTFQVKQELNTFFSNGTDAAQIITSLFVVLPDLEELESVYDAAKALMPDEYVQLRDFYTFDLACEEEMQLLVQEAFSNNIYDIAVAAEDYPAYSSACAAASRDDFYGSFGGLFFLGIMLGCVFMLSAVLIMYYKQLTEGYEDQARFDILQKVGMTRQEIRRSINSQVLTVFFLPLVTAGIHTAFDFPLISRILIVFGMTNTKLLILITAACYLVFALIYVLVYLATSRAYYSIVSTNERAA